MKTFKTSFGTAFVGFNSWTEIEAYASKHDLDIVSFTQRPGQRGYDFHGTEYEPFDTREMMGGISDHWTAYYSVNDFWEGVEYTLKDMRESDDFTEEEINNWLKAQQENREKIAAMSEEQFAVVYETDYCEILEKKCITFLDDKNGTLYEIGCHKVDED